MIIAKEIISGIHALLKLIRPDAQVTAALKNKNATEYIVVNDAFFIFFFFRPRSQPYCGSIYLQVDNPQPVIKS